MIGVLGWVWGGGTYKVAEGSGGSSKDGVCGAVADEPHERWDGTAFA